MFGSSGCLQAVEGHESALERHLRSGRLKAIGTGEVPLLAVALRAGPALSAVGEGRRCSISLLGL